MDRLIIRGGRRLAGTVDIAGAKNAALPLIAASLLSDRPVTLANLPAITDVETMLALAGGYGVRVTRGQAHQATLDAAAAANAEAHYDTVRRARATALVLGPLLGRFGRARVSLPGGCAIGARPIDLHLKALTALGAEVAVDGGYVTARAPQGGLTGARIVLTLPSVGATETALMAAVTARGETEILNAAREPEVADLAACLVAMGAHIEGAGTQRLLVQGPSSFRPATHTLIPDRIEAGTYAVAAAITGGRLELIGARLEHLAVQCQILERAGVSVYPTDRGLMVERAGHLRATDVSTEPYPGFPTDLQAQFMALMSVAEGAAMIRETIFENRFMHVPELARLGADLTLRGTSVLVRGVERLRGAPVMATDLRASVCLILAGLVAEGETVVNRVYHLDRGYEDLARKLVRCGADIERVPG
ncbi:UDP-N-acetylglucosamine 1-carboxyvinyltransferase [Nitrospirillum viridazoti]|uniref:UDP-N-acetylglucosamine 1-carboxyvinyltransferase n=1 Tax=Nitrospirillum amazonense TaxID=28077 RepID=A0A560IBV4_9PROT|nr:UDP-N-acetylglucosamine 1-carboxyvinyltransferase [Nitrospirillum amazonense]TWB56537.1 UDP-N-acetylglucosamine 1-carboxyvinyltransferase [Nitrospirillum amazonense]